MRISDWSSCVCSSDLGAGDAGGEAVRARALERGYTLVEVLVAFAILALALTLLLGTLSGAARQVEWSGQAGRAALHAQSMLEGIGVAEALRQIGRAHV